MKKCHKADHATIVELRDAYEEAVAEVAAVKVQSRINLASAERELVLLRQGLTPPDYPAATRSLVAAVKAQVKAERERDEARALIRLVRGIHFEISISPVCAGCGRSYPCRTVRALNGDPVSEPQS